MTMKKTALICIILFFSLLVSAQKVTTKKNAYSIFWNGYLKEIILTKEASNETTLKYYTKREYFYPNQEAKEKCPKVFKLIKKAKKSNIYIAKKYTEKDSANHIKKFIFISGIKKNTQIIFANLPTYQTLNFFPEKDALLIVDSINGNELHILHGNYEFLEKIQIPSSSIFSVWDNKKGDWKLRHKHIFTTDSTKNILEKTSYKWSSTNHKWIFYEQTTFKLSSNKKEEISYQQDKDSSYYILKQDIDNFYSNKAFAELGKQVINQNPTNRILYRKTIQMNQQEDTISSNLVFIKSLNLSNTKNNVFYVCINPEVKKKTNGILKK